MVLLRCFITKKWASFCGLLLPYSVNSPAPLVRPTSPSFSTKCILRRCCIFSWSCWQEATRSRLVKGQRFSGRIGLVVPFWHISQRVEPEVVVGTGVSAPTRICAIQKSFGLLYICWSWVCQPACFLRQLGMGSLYPYWSLVIVVMVPFIGNSHRVGPHQDLWGLYSGHDAASF